MLILHEVDKRYPNGVHALKCVSYHIDKGIYGLLGPNGAGKSSLMRTIALLQSPSSGTITWQGKAIAENRDWFLRQFGYLPQDFGVYPGVSAEKLLDHFAVLKGLGSAAYRQARVQELLERTNLWAHRKTAVSTYSGGMRQRFGIAVTLLATPKLIVVDEPTTGLDPAERYRFHTLLASLGEDVSILLSTHIVDDVADLAREVAVLVDGELLRCDTPAKLVEAYAGRIWRIDAGTQTSAGATQPGQVISTRVRNSKLVSHILADTQPGKAYKAVDPDLEDVYFATLKEVGHASVENLVEAA